MENRNSKRFRAIVTGAALFIGLALIGHIANILQILESDTAKRIYQFAIGSTIHVPVWIALLSLALAVAYLFLWRDAPQSQRQSASQSLYTDGEFHRRFATMIDGSRSLVLVCFIEDNWIFRHILLVTLARLRGVEFRIIVQASSAAERHNLLRLLGCTVMHVDADKPRPGFQGVIVDPRDAHHGSAITLSIKEGCFAQYHTSPHDFYVISACASLVRSMECTASASPEYTPSIEPFPLDLVLERLREVRFYRNARFEHVDVAIAELLPISSVVQSAKVFQAERLIRYYEDRGLALFTPLAIKLANERFSIIVPPVVEAHGDKLTIAEGHSRLFALRRRGIRTAKVIKVVGVDVQPPSPPLSWRSVVCSDEKELVDNPELARRIETTAHQNVWN